MKKRIKLCLLSLASFLLLTGCKSINQDNAIKKEMNIEGYVVEKEGEIITVGSAFGNYQFDITNAKIISDDEISEDDTCHVYYSENLDDKKINIATKVEEYFASTLIGEVEEVDKEKGIITIKSDNITYKFKIDKKSKLNIADIKENNLYQLEFDKKPNTSKINEAKKIEILKVDEAPNEELEMIEASTNSDDSDNK